MIMQDSALAEQMMEFAIQSCHRCEKGDKVLSVAITSILPQLFSVGPFLHYFFSSLPIRSSLLTPLLMQISINITLIRDYYTQWAKQEAQ